MQDARKKKCSIGFSDGGISEGGRSSLRALLIDKCSLRMAVLNANTFDQIRQQTTLVMSLDTFKVHVKGVSKIHIQDPISITTLV